MFRVTNKVASYSKKGGGGTINIVLAKDLETYEAALEIVKKSGARLTSEFKKEGKKYIASTRGLLYPGEIVITEYKKKDI